MRRSTLRLAIALCTALLCGPAFSAAAPAEHHIQSLKITILSTMLADDGIGEWGFAALVEVDGQKLLVDTGAHPDTVLQNAHELGIDLSQVHDVVLTHFHNDHVGGLLRIRTEMQAQSAGAIGNAYVAKGIFYSRPGDSGKEANSMIGIRARYEATGAHFTELADLTQIQPGVWLTGPVPRPFPEHNWSGNGQVVTPAGMLEDTVPDDQSLIIETAKGLVVVTGCGHAGIVNILTRVRQQWNRPVIAVIGGVHLFAASDATVDWTAGKLKEFGVQNLIGAHCTGIESLYRLRNRMGLTRQTAVVGAVGARFSLAEGIRPGRIAQ
jgi:7,8-dihydropterin-6-yl-methyl-4-(beta-D-ribofuranosyl)aminobenzene 5'-phosphate synthase